ncbi:hypothetical protein F5883DRAFT_40375 [Diaporthe sp. PMI_573]|nr:hypothetical protein F5883DRAFT_40375 [Diaporthaceae sp. PMI_573]
MGKHENRIRKSRFTAENTQGAAENFNNLLKKPIVLSHAIAETTEDDRRRAMLNWEEFIEHRKPDAVLRDNVWEWMAGDNLKEQGEAMALCKNYLTFLVRTSEQTRPVWGPEETREERTLTTVSAVNTCWKSLVAAAQMQLNKKAASTGRVFVLARRQGPAGAQDTGPATMVTEWIKTDLKDDFGLTPDSEYEKVGARCEDIERLLRTLWERADDIPMSPRNRVAVHIYIIILYVSGCRPGMLETIRWRHFKLFLTMDKSEADIRRLHADLTLYFNKLRRRVVVRSDDDHFSFPVTLMPTLLLDLTHLIAALALLEGAFEAGFSSVEDMLNRPTVDDKTSTPLRWKQEFLDRRICDMKCDAFRIYFKRLCIVSGLQNPPRPYFLRVGAGANFEASGMPMSTKLRLLSHTFKVDVQSYQAQRISQDLQGAAFGELAGDNEALFKYLSHGWDNFDPDAPCYMTEAQRLEMEARMDTAELRETLLALRSGGGQQKEIQKASQKLRSHRKRLEELAILHRRGIYFEEKQRSRQAGLQGPQLKTEPEYCPGKRVHDALDISSLMEAWAVGTNYDAWAEMRAIRAMNWLMHYLSGSLSAISLPSRSPSPEDQAAREGGPTALQLPAGKRSMCLICGKKYARRVEMTRHAMKHKAALFRPYPCPLCGETTNSPSEFSNHVERRHGREHAPNFPSGLSPTAPPEQPKAPPGGAQAANQIICTFCLCDLKPKSFLHHFHMHHRGAVTSHVGTVACAVCPGESELDLRSWVAHQTDRHGLFPTAQCPFCDHLFTARGIGLHIRKAHFDGGSGGGLSCPLCPRAGGTAPLITDHAAWLVHLQAAAHDIDQATAMSAGAPQLRAGAKRKAEDDGPHVPGYAAPQVQAPPPKVRRLDAEGAACGPTPPGTAPLSPVPALDLSLIDPAILGARLSSAIFEDDEQRSSYGLSPQSLGGSTVCTTPSLDCASPVGTPEPVCASPAEAPESVCASAVPPPCIDMDDSFSTPSSSPSEEEEIVLDTIYVASTPAPPVERPKRRSQRRTRGRLT